MRTFIVQAIEVVGDGQRNVELTLEVDATAHIVTARVSNEGVVTDQPAAD